MIFWSRVIVGSSLARFKNSLGADNQGNPLHVRFDLSFYKEIEPVGPKAPTAPRGLGLAHCFVQQPELSLRLFVVPQLIGAPGAGLRLLVAHHDAAEVGRRLVLA